MTIQSGGYNVNLNPTPTIYELQTAGRQDLQNAADIGKGNVMIVPQSQADEVPFQKAAERSTWLYRSEADRPTLKPLTTLRGAAPDIQVTDNAWETQYEDLKDQLPDAISALLDEPPTSELASMKDAIETSAKFLAGLGAAEVYTTTENAVNRAAANQAFPTYAYGNSLTSSKEMAEAGDALLDEVGPNDPGYGEAKEFAQSMGSVLKDVKRG